MNESFLDNDAKAQFPFSNLHNFYNNLYGSRIVQVHNVLISQHMLFDFLQIPIGHILYYY
jgi:hypothetical protein